MLGKIIDSCDYVSKNSNYVRINEYKLNEFASSLRIKENPHWLSSSPYGLLDLSVEKIVNFLLVFESIDFSFWGNPKWKISTSHGEEDGSIALLYTILKYVNENNTADFSNISKKDFGILLKGTVEIPLFEKRLDIIKNVSQVVNDKMNGNFYNYIKNMNTDIELFETIVEFFPNFKDERMYNGKSIYFYKLAQLLTSDILNIRKVKENINVDISHLVGCADYKIPQVMRGLGILEYSDELSKIVDSKMVIEPNSKYEVEIRANMIIVINKIKEKLENSICAMDINDYIFCMSKDKSIKLNPYHLTRCINY